MLFLEGVSLQEEPGCIGSGVTLCLCVLVCLFLVFMLVLEGFWSWEEAGGSFVVAVVVVVGGGWKGCGCKRRMLIVSCWEGFVDYVCFFLCFVLLCLVLLCLVLFCFLFWLVGLFVNLFVCLLLFVGLVWLGLVWFGLFVCLLLLLLLRTTATTATILPTTTTTTQKQEPSQKTWLPPAVARNIGLPTEKSTGRGTPAGGLRQPSQKTWVTVAKNTTDAENTPYRCKKHDQDRRKKHALPPGPSQKTPATVAKNTSHGNRRKKHEN